MENLPCADMVVMAQGKPLEDEQVLSQCGSDEATFDVLFRMLGGTYFDISISFKERLVFTLRTAV